MSDPIQKLINGNRFFRDESDPELRIETARNGQHPYAVVISCSDSRVIPEAIFHAGIGELFVIRVAGNVLGTHALGSIAYAVEHLGCKEIVVLGHTGCGAVSAALSHESEGLIAELISDIRSAIGDETDPLQACEKNVRHWANHIRQVFSDQIKQDINVRGAVYELESGDVRWV